MKAPVDPSRWADLGPRAASAAVMIVIGTACVVAGGVWFQMVTVFVTAVMIWELWTMIEPQGPTRGMLLAAFLSLFVTPSVYRSGAYPVRAFWVEALQWSGYVTMGFLACLVLFGIPGDLLKLLVRIAAWFPGPERGTAAAIFNSAQYFSIVAFAPLMGWLVHAFGWRSIQISA